MKAMEEEKHESHQKRDDIYISYERSSRSNQAYSMAELKEYARELGLPTTGNKKELVDRILEHRSRYYNSYTLQDLRQYAKQRGLSTTGNKQDLIDRILENRF